MKRFTAPLIVLALLVGFVLAIHLGWLDLYIQTTLMFIGVNVRDSADTANHTDRSPDVGHQMVGVSLKGKRTVFAAGGKENVRWYFTLRYAARTRPCAAGWSGSGSRDSPAVPRPHKCR